MFVLRVLLFLGFCFFATAENSILPGQACFRGYSYLKRLLDIKPEARSLVIEAQNKPRNFLENLSSFIKNEKSEIEVEIKKNKKTLEDLKNQRQANSLLIDEYEKRIFQLEARLESLYGALRRQSVLEIRSLIDELRSFRVDLPIANLQRLIVNIEGGELGVPARVNPEELFRRVSLFIQNAETRGARF